MSQRVFLVYEGHQHDPARLGTIPGVVRGLARGERVEVTSSLLRSLNRPAGTEEDFATFIAGVYNANRPIPRWSATIEADRVESTEPPAFLGYAPINETDDSDEELPA